MTSLRTDKPSGRPMLPTAAVAQLTSLLETRSPSLPEWFDVAEHHNYVAPAPTVPALMTAALSHPEHRERLLLLAGPRGQYLADHNPDWAQLRRVGSRRDELWLSTDTDDRMAWFDYIRTLDPALATEELEIAWATETPSLRRDFLGRLRVGLGEHDYDLLERGLDDSSIDVRERSIQLLRQLPGSPFAERMTARAKAWVRLETKPLRPRLVIRLPGSLDSQAPRDGIENVHNKYKGIGKWWLRQVVTATPLALWDSMIGSPREALRIPIEKQWHDVMTESWTAATVLQTNSAWASALLERDGRNTDRRVVAIANPRERIAYILDGHADDYLLGVDGSALLDGIGHPWPLAVAQKLVSALETEAAEHAASGEELGIHSRHSHYSTLRSAQARFPLEAVALLSGAANRASTTDWQRAFTETAAHIEDRRIRLDVLRNG
ncbi:DUF5691 domain-containing protein [Rhodococcus sp. ARC_M6]|uniref:DUF5691 domain-containing protein n=1 Tax=Rhodococcus sp. ARC_M6 TaxID=2928852 RepID=UPI001FB53F21|nr:DUF5691 domain-containing protein [Rhodococcus sp. ARC_M6]MCJ0904753.1 DUF5691 domain-containing protein [Rhodococcus sp. ARC_M6]